MQAGERLEKYEVELLRIYNALPSIRLQILFMQRALDFEEEFSGKSSQTSIGKALLLE